jgi:hypothetical protein
MQSIEGIVFEPITLYENCELLKVRGNHLFNIDLPCN